MVEIVTRRIRHSPGAWILGAIIVFSGLSSPILAKYTPDILSAMVDPQAAELLGAQFRDPSWKDSYTGWVKNLNQVSVFAIIIVCGIELHSHLNGGTAPLILTRNVARRAYVSSYLAAWGAALTGMIAIGSAVTWAMTLSIFGSAPLIPLLSSGFLWLILILLLIITMTLAEAIWARIGSTLVSGIGLFLTLSLGGIWTWGRDHSPLGMIDLISSEAVGNPANWLAPVVGTLALAGLMWATALMIYDRADI